MQLEPDICQAQHPTDSCAFDAHRCGVTGCGREVLTVAVAVRRELIADPTVKLAGEVERTAAQSILDNASG